MKIYVVAFAPNGSDGGVGGFNWFTVKSGSISKIQEYLGDSGYDLAYFERVVLFDPGSYDSRAVTEWCEQNLELP